MANTRIEWTHGPYGEGMVWNVVRGCSAVSPGCRNCYAQRQAIRQAGPGGNYEGLVENKGSGPRWTGAVRFVPEKLSEPLHWRKPRMVFVNSMGDLFHESVTDHQLDGVFGVMSACRYLGPDAAPGHTFLCLTKRQSRMREYLSSDRRKEWAYAAVNLGGGSDQDGLWDQVVFGPRELPNVWLGVSAEDQRRADERIPHLLATPAAVRFVSCEPLLGPVDLDRYLTPLRQESCINCGDHDREWLVIEDMIWDEHGDARCLECGDTRTADGSQDGLDWVIVGGESGPGARPCNLSWIRNIVYDCEQAHTPLFVKQLGSHVVDSLGREDDEEPMLVGLPSRKGQDPEEWESYLRVRQFPSREAPNGKANL